MRILQYVKNNFRTENIYLYFLVILTFAMSFFIRPLPYLIAATGLSWLLSKNLKNKITILFHYKFFLLIASFYLLHLIGILYTENLHRGRLSLEVKLSLLVLPIVIFSSQSEIRAHIKYIVGAFIAGNFISLIICIFLAFYKAHLNSVGNEFLNFAVWHSHENWPFFKLIFSGISLLNYTWFSYFIHPNYFSMYISLSLYILYLKLINTKDLPKKDYFLYLSLITFLLICLLLLQSRASILVLGIVVVYEAIYNVFKGRNKLIKLSIAAILLTAILISIATSVRFKYVVIGETKLNYSKLRENNVRIQLWEKIDVILEDKWLTGVGTGDVKDSFDKVYTKELYEASGGIHLNFHNEFIETTVRLGIPGLIVLCILILHPLFLRRNYQQNRILIVFTLILLLNFFFESMLVRLNGVLFFSLFYCLLNLNDENGKKFVLAK